MKRLILGIIALAGIAGFTHAQEEAPRGNPLGMPYVYKKVDGRELRVYVQNPPGWKAGDQRPAIVLIHGGGFIGGGPATFNDQCEYLASRGLVAISVQYRLLDKERSTAPVICNQDAKSAMRWVRAHAAELGIDPARIAAGGGSAGGEMAAFCGLSPGGDDPADDVKVSPKPAALLLLNPAIAIGDGSWNNEAAKKPGGEEYLRLAPAKFVSADAPPTLLLSGEKDQVVPMVFLKKFQADMRAAGVRCEAVFYAGQGHAFFHRQKAGGKYYYETLLEMDKFLISLGWLQGAPTLVPDAPVIPSKS